MKFFLVCDFYEFEIELFNFQQVSSVIKSEIFFCLDKSKMVQDIGIATFMPYAYYLHSTIILTILFFGTGKDSIRRIFRHRRLQHFIEQEHRKILQITSDGKLELSVFSLRFGNRDFLCRIKNSEWNDSYQNVDLPDDDCSDVEQMNEETVTLGNLVFELILFLAFWSWYHEVDDSKLNKFVHNASIYLNLCEHYCKFGYYERKNVSGCWTILSENDNYTTIGRKCGKTSWASGWWLVSSFSSRSSIGGKTIDK